MTSVSNLGSNSSLPEYGRLLTKVWNLRIHLIAYTIWLPVLQIICYSPDNESRTFQMHSEASTMFTVYMSISVGTGDMNTSWNQRHCWLAYSYGKNWKPAMFQVATTKLHGLRTCWIWIPLVHGLQFKDWCYTSQVGLHASINLTSCKNFLQVRTTCETLCK